MTIPTIDHVCTHLRLLGYTTNTKTIRDEQVIMAINRMGRKIALQACNDGVLFTTIFPGNGFVEKDKEGYLNFINSLNQDVTVARVYADYDNDLLFESWFPDNYEKASFSRFFELWDHDTGAQLIEKAIEAKKYLVLH